jgi:hypothetical protein
MSIIGMSTFLSSTFWTGGSSITKSSERKKDKKN